MGLGYTNSVDESAQVFYNYGGYDATPVHFARLANDLLATVRAHKLTKLGVYSNESSGLHPPRLPTGVRRRMDPRAILHLVKTQAYERRCQREQRNLTQERGTLESVIRRHFPDLKTSADCAAWARTAASQATRGL
jgi:hypothetical protein